MLIFQKKLRILSLGEVFTIILRKKSCIMLKLFTGPSAPFNKKLKIYVRDQPEISLLNYMEKYRARAKFGQQEYGAIANF